jgi:deazaflavin-dependent oxidoreductase (nitroreductase family)
MSAGRPSSGGHKSQAFRACRGRDGCHEDPRRAAGLRCLSTRALMLRLTTIGRRSGQPRVATVSYCEDGENLVRLATNGWAEAEPAWWLNLQAQPDRTVELPDRRRAVRGRAAEGEERDRCGRDGVSSATSTMPERRCVPQGPRSSSSSFAPRGTLARPATRRQRDVLAAYVAAWRACARRGGARRDSAEHREASSCGPSRAVGPHHRAADLLLTSRWVAYCPESRAEWRCNSHVRVPDGPRVRLQHPDHESHPRGGPVPSLVVLLESRPAIASGHRRRTRAMTPSSPATQ